MLIMMTASESFSLNSMTKGSKKIPLPSNGDNIKNLNLLSENVKIDVLSEEKNEKMAKESLTVDVSQDDSQKTPNLKSKRNLTNSTQEKIQKKATVKKIMGDVGKCNPFQRKRIENSLKHILSKEDKNTYVGTAPYEAVRAVQIFNKNHELQYNEFLQKMLNLDYSDYYVTIYDVCYVGESPLKIYYTFYEKPEANFKDWLPHTHTIEDGNVEQVKKLIIKIALAYKHLHEKNILQASSNLNTLWVFKDNKVKISHLNFSKFFKSKEDPKYKELLGWEFNSMSSMFRDIMRIKNISDGNMRTAINRISDYDESNQVKSVDEFLRLFAPEKFVIVV
jgi:hypothetical protein